MSAAIQANIVIDLPDNVNAEKFTNMLREELSKINGMDTQVNVSEMDDFRSTSPIHLKTLREYV